MCYWCGWCAPGLFKLRMIAWSPGTSQIASCPARSSESTHRQVITRFVWRRCWRWWWWRCKCDDGGGADGDGGVGEASSSSFDVMVEMASLAISVISLFLRLLYIGANVSSIWKFIYTNLKVQIPIWKFIFFNNYFSYINLKAHIFLIIFFIFQSEISYFFI